MDEVDDIDDDESPELDLWAGLKFDPMAVEIWVIDDDGNWERAPVLNAVIVAMQVIPRAPKRAGQIRAAAFNICSAAAFADIANQPNLKANRGGTAKDVKEIIRIHDLCFDLVDSLYKLHQGSREALEDGDQRGLRQFQREVGKWSDRAVEVWSALEAGEQQPRIPGAPTKDIEAKVRRAALHEFERLTGETVARGHPDYSTFKTFLSRLFEALGYPKNAESQARQAVQDRDAKRN